MMTFRYFALVAAVLLQTADAATVNSNFPHATTGISCGDHYSFLIDSSDPEWADFNFPSDDATGATVYISDELSVKTHDAYTSDTFSTIEADECILTAAATSLVSTGDIDLDDCKPDLNMNDTHIIYTYTVWHDPRDLTKQINREEPVSVCYHCEMVRDQEKNSLLIKPQMTIDHYDTLGVEGTFTISLVLQQPKGSDLSASASVDVNTKVWIEAELTGVDSTDDTLALAFTDCWASPNMNYFKQYQFIQDDCPVDDGVGTDTADDDEGFTKLVEQGTETKAVARFQSFVWNRVQGEIVSPTDASKQKIYITCMVQVCSEAYLTATSAGNCAGQYSCQNGDVNSRRKRSLGKFRRDASPKHDFPAVMLTAHPVSINAEY